MNKVLNELKKEAENSFVSYNSAVSTLAPLEKLEYSKNVTFFFWRGGITIYHLTRREVLDTIKAMGGGKWRKDINSLNGDLEYMNDINDFRIELKTNELPDSCRLEKEHVVVPARPEEIVEKFVLVCNKMEQE